jgi:hypothetical protein
MSTVAIDNAASSNAAATTESTERIQTVVSENDHNECSGCQARKALEDALDSCLDVGFGRDAITDVVEEKLWESVNTQLFVAVDACIENGWPLTEILEEVELQHAYMMDRSGKESEVIPLGDPIVLSDAA